MNRKSIYLLLILVCALTSNRANAQRDTGRKQFEVVSAYKPVLRNAIKINFNASPPVPDSSKPRLSYNIPAQNLFFSYQPVSLKPLALDIDSGGYWANSNFIKLGFGNFQTPYINAGFTLGDGHNAGVSIYAKHLAQKGPISFQQYSQTNFGLRGFFKTGKNLEWNAHALMNQDLYYRYGFEPRTIAYTKDDIRQRFQTISFGASLRNIKATEFSLFFNPSLDVQIFNDASKNTEGNAVLNLPLEKLIGKTFGIKLGLTADFTNYNRNLIPNKVTINNNLFYVSPALMFKTPNVTIHGGIRPSWDNSAFFLLPNIMADVRLNEDKFVLQAGWIGYYNKTNYMGLSKENPWLAAPSALLNTRIQERYAGFRGTIANHFNYSAKAGFIQYNNIPLFVNNKIDGSSFQIRNEEELKALQLHGEIGVTQGEQFSLNAGVDLRQFSSQKTEDAPWGLTPLELKASLRWQLMKDLWIRGDAFAWAGAKFQPKAGGEARLPGAADLNAGLEFRITKGLNLWVQMNNILNNKYQRWSQYETLGFNVLGGIVFSFAQNNKR